MQDLFDIDDGEDDELPAPSGAADTTDRAIEKYFETGRLRVVQERNDFFLPHVVDFIEGRKWGNLHPEYQRRRRWDNVKKSRLIESFVMNVPVPPVFLYEKELGSFEVMDGQQRLSAIIEFLQGRFDLTGLKIWPALNGRSFPKLPPLVRRGLERAKVSAITLMSDSSTVAADDMALRAQVFERLNTGGERLNPQELRNSLYSGPFNKLIIELSRLKNFTNAWDIPSHDEHTLSDDEPDAILKENNLYKRMVDVEIVLRFFAFMDRARISGSVRRMLDNTLKLYRNANVGELEKYRDYFTQALTLSLEVFGDQAFRLPPSNMKGQEKGSLSRPLYDAEMVALHRLSAKRAEIIERRGQVIENVSALAKPGANTYDLMVGRANTAQAILDRVAAVEAAILEAL
jgi:hypothetical protein